MAPLSERYEPSIESGDNCMLPLPLFSSRLFMCAFVNYSPLRLLVLLVQPLRPAKKIMLVTTLKVIFFFPTSIIFFISLPSLLLVLLFHMLLSYYDFGS